MWDKDDQDYLRSLHLPKSDAYDNIYGNDKIGEYRNPTVEYQPMEYHEVIDPVQSGLNGVIYYEGSTSNYYEYVDDQWVKVNKSRMDKILDDKAYIDMPNASTFWFIMHYFPDWKSADNSKKIITKTRKFENTKNY